MAIREGRWDCNSCGNKNNRGSQKECPSCGKVRGGDVEFYLPSEDEELEVSDENELKKAKAGPDWYCIHCESGNSRLMDKCSHCGAKKGTSPSHDASKDNLKKEIDRKNRAIEAIKSHGKESKKDSSKKPFSYLWRVNFFLLFLLAIFMLIPNETKLVVTGFSWERSIDTEQEKTFTEQGWSIPLGGRILKSEIKFHYNNKILDHYDTKYRDLSKKVLDHYKTVYDDYTEEVRDGYETKTKRVSERVKTGTKKVKTGTRSKGNGYFEDTYSYEPVYETKYRTETYQVLKYKTIHKKRERKEAVYKTVYYKESYEDPVYRYEPVNDPYYTYDIERWIPFGVEKAKGLDKNPYWPVLNLLAKQREAAKKEIYTITLSSLKEKDGKKETYSLTLPLSEWMSYEYGEIVKAVFVGSSLQKIEKPEQKTQAEAVK